MSQQKRPDPQVAPSAIRTQLGRILASEPFANARRMQRFLAFVVEETLAGRADQLGEYGIGLAVFDRSPSFEPALDPIVRNDARRLRAKLAEYYDRPRSEAECVIEIPKGGYVPKFLSLPTAESNADRLPGDLLRVAVLPFETISVTPESALCARALSMSLTARLTNVEGVETIAHACLPDQRFQDAASELRLSLVVNGCLWKSGDRWHVIVNLIQVARGTQLWAAEYEFGAGKTATVHSDIAAQVIGQLQSRLRPQTSTARCLAIAA